MDHADGQHQEPEGEQARPDARPEAATATTMPPAWSDLIEGLTLLAKHHTSDISPLHCEHDTLNVMADDEAFTGEEIARLDHLGFSVSSEGGFYSFRFGSA
ncbi:hypothetical protein GCM10010399_63850 [Dactylosporangium fulvum]|uniref:Uncharacterized protein n=1 Tax=Dactylosporangium fulvum TaxID=53359 RepID=A0ABY5W6S8_9ACTN|nr:hypothetical protein [Dactylosporangium fulvum]UWP85792.1 hypothetical protein Dfulv_16730 [Dactylosporangium fulvum]